MLKETFYIFNQNMVRIFLLSLLVVMPVSYLIQSFVIYFLNTEYLLTPNLYSLCMILFNFTVLFPPFIVMAKQYLNDEEYSLKSSIVSFLDNFFLILVVTIVAFIIMVIGAPLIFIPTLVSLAFLLVFPITAVEDIQLGNKIKKTWLVIKIENIGILGDLILVISLNIALWFLLTLFVNNLENNLLVYLTLKIMINTMFFPLIYIFLTVKYHKIKQ
jgi:hypothetical protein